MFRRLLQCLFGDKLEGRSPCWLQVRAEHLKQNPICVCCGTDDDLEVHHLKPFWLYHDLECDPCNLRTVCRDHHFLVGHGMDWKAWNPAFDSDARYIREMIAKRKYGR